jgi:hypothetical protein
MPTKPLDRLLFAQGGLCFFCAHPLPKADASVEHLVASANGGSNSDENCVVCCKAMNTLLGSMSLKEKIRVVLNQKGQFKCPNGLQKPRPKPADAQGVSKAILDQAKLVVANLRQRGPARPKTVKTLMSTIRSLFPRNLAEERLSLLVQQLQANGFIEIDGTRVVYAKFAAAPESS